MASVILEPGGHRRIDFFDAGGRRRRVRLGKVGASQAASVKGRIEQLIAGKITGHAAAPDTLKWLSDLPDVLRDRLARAGLVDRRERAGLAAFLDAYIAGRRPMKPRTELILKRSRDVLVAYLGEDTDVADVSRADAAAWRTWLQSSGHAGGGPLAPNSVANHVKRAKLFFRVAIDRRMITENPFAKLPSVINGNATRQRFITAAEAAAVMQACPDDEWRLIFALSRYGGLRCPSETLSLQWSDVDFKAGRLTIRSPKTEHHAGGDTRQIPIFPELRPLLQATRGEAGFVIRRYRSSTSNLRTRLHRIIKRAGLTPWPRAFHNLRASRQTELAETFPIHVVCAWLGNTEKIAIGHYLQVTPEHFERAARGAESGAQNNALPKS